MLTIGRLAHGGAEMRLLQLLRAMQQRGVQADVTIYVVSGREGPLDPEFRATGAEIIYGRPGVRGLIEIVRLCRSRDFHVFHANASLAGGIYCLAAWVGGAPARISHIRSTGYDAQGVVRKMRNWVYRQILNRSSTKVVGVCKNAQHFAGTPNERWVTIYNGFECTATEIDRPSIDGVLRIVMLGRIAPPKNPFRVLGIAEALQQRLSPGAFRVEMIGGGHAEMRQKLQEEIQSRNLEDLIVVRDPTNDPLGCLRAASVLLLTSTREGLPGVVLEALACGTPVVASRLPGVEEIAAVLPGVVAVDLGQHDSTWAAALVKAPSLYGRSEIVRAFLESPFTFAAHYSKMLNLWNVADGRNEACPIVRD